MQKHHQQDENGEKSFGIFNLPTPNEAEAKCFNKLRHAQLKNSSHDHANINQTVNLEKKCKSASFHKWDPDRKKLFKSEIRESCCALYDALECIEKEARQVCTDVDLNQLIHYRRKTETTMSATVCKTIPNHQRLCSSNGHRVFASAITMFIAICICIVFFG